MIRSLLAASLLCLGTAALAQAPQITLGKVAEVQGVVTVSDGVTVGTAVPGTVITDGNRFVTASAGAARLTLDNGCVINLKPNESLTINSKLSCRDLVASVRAVGSQTVLAGTGFSGNTLLAAGSLLGAGLVARRDALRSNPPSLALSPQ